MVEFFAKTSLKKIKMD